MTGSAASGRDEVLALLAEFGGRTPEEVPERIDSMELAWLVHVIEERHGCRLSDETLSRVATVTDVVELLAAIRGGSRI
ncbi:acyl carrier protein [Streptomyces sp. TLI_171]|uniref:acyl carrier protein n=1 Tax=Streptomyces sp. TLI_171 TaxID=1938859 RepID=UPI000C17FBA2|nr:acyl carrier protein [Streptomyces sp. TLI_171]RKE23372.1 acyl carrier protein [Streptomyces sp. TLI_171]